MAVLHVAAGSNGDGSVTSPFGSIQQAVNAADTGDRIEVAEGTYRYSPAFDKTSATLGLTSVVTIQGKKLSIYGGFTRDDNFTTANPLANPTIIDGENERRGLYVVGASTPTGIDLQGFTIRNGLATGIPTREGGLRFTAFGGGVYIDLGNQQKQSTPLTFRNLTFEDNLAQGSDAGVLGDNAAGAGSGGAFYSIFANDLRMENVIFRNNTSIGGDGGVVAGRALGGAISANYTKLTADNVTFVGNKAIGGFTATGTGSVDDLPADAAGGAVSLQIACEGIFRHMTAINNQAIGGGTGNTANGTDGGGAYGGAILTEVDVVLRIEDSVIADNLALSGSGFKAGLAGGGGIIAFETDVVLERVQIVRNRAEAGPVNTPGGLARGATGGGIYILDRTKEPPQRGRVLFRNVLVADNEIIASPTSDNATGGGGGGVRLQGTTARFEHVTIANNVMGPNVFFGGAILLSNDKTRLPTTLSLVDSIITGHGPARTPAVALFLGTEMTVERSIFAGNENNFFIVPLGTGPNSDRDGKLMGEASIISQSPQYTDGPNGNYSLQANSPAINAATGSTVPVDVSGTARFGVPDIGAFESGTPNDFASGSTASGAGTTSPPKLPARPVRTFFAVGSINTATLYDGDFSPLFTIDSPFGGFGGEIRAASGDVDGDGTPDLIVATGPGGATRLKVYRGTDRAEIFALDVFEASFTGGLYVTAGDINGDGFDDIVVSPDRGGGPRVRGFDGKSLNQVFDFFAIDDPNFRGGARAALGDIDGDDLADLLVGAGFTGGPRVAGFNATSLLNGGTAVKLFEDFFLFEPSLRNGAYVTLGDTNGDGFADVIGGGGPGGGPRVFGLSGKDLIDSNGATRNSVVNYFAGNPDNRDGVTLVAADLDGDALTDLVTGPGDGSAINGFAGSTLTSGSPSPSDTLSVGGLVG